MSPGAGGGRGAAGNDVLLCCLRPHMAGRQAGAVGRGASSSWRRRQARHERARAPRGAARGPLRASPRMEHGSAAGPLLLAAPVRKAQLGRSSPSTMHSCSLKRPLDLLQTEHMIERTPSSAGSVSRCAGAVDGEPVIGGPSHASQARVWIWLRGACGSTVPCDNAAVLGMQLSGRQQLRAWWGTPPASQPGARCRRVVSCRVARPPVTAGGTAVVPTLAMRAPSPGYWQRGGQGARGRRQWGIDDGDYCRAVGWLARGDGQCIARTWWRRGQGLKLEGKGLPAWRASVPCFHQRRSMAQFDLCAACPRR
jgi:hypothetical protein